MATNFGRLLLLTIGLAGCASGGQPEEDGGAGPITGSVSVPSVYALIGERERLQLTSEQVVALDSIGEWLSRANSPIEEELREMGVPTGPFSGRIRGDLPEEARVLLDELNANNELALSTIEAELTDEQEARICEATESEETSANDRNRRTEVDTVGLTRPGRWRWCGRSAPSA